MDRAEINLNPYQGLKLHVTLEMFCVIYSRNKPKSLSGIETVRSSSGCRQSNGRNKPKSLSGIETGAWFDRADFMARSRNKPKSLSGIETRTGQAF